MGKKPSIIQSLGGKRSFITWFVIPILGSLVILSFLLFDSESGFYYKRLLTMPALPLMIAVVAGIFARAAASMRRPGR